MLKSLGQRLLMGIDKELLFREMYYKYIEAPQNCYTAENDKHRYIFIHIPKTGGMSLLYSLFGEKEILGHRNILRYKYSNAKKFHDYFKFAVVRNPWDRFASSYFFLLNGGITDSDKHWGEANLANYPDFEAFVLSLRKKRHAMHILSWRHFQPQTYWIADHSKSILLDYIARFEQYEESYTHLKRIFSVDLPLLAHINKGSHSGGYNQYYTTEMRTIIGDLYDSDIKLLGYEASH